MISERQFYLLNVNARVFSLSTSTSQGSLLTLLHLTKDINICIHTSINQLFTGNSSAHNLRGHQTTSDHSGLVDPDQINKNITVFRITRPAQVCQTVIKISSIEIVLIATAKGRPWSLGWKASAALPRVVHLFLTIMTLTQESMLVN